MNNTQTINIGKGFYTLLYSNGDHRTIQVKECKTGNFAGKTIVGFLTGADNENDYQFFGFLSNGRVSFWKSFSAKQTPERLRRIVRALEMISSDEKAAGKAYAFKSGRCYRCNRHLTTPESIVAGIGADCAEKVGAARPTRETVTRLFIPPASTAKPVRVGNYSI